MTPSKILELVQKEADARMGDTIERLLSILKCRHTHRHYKRECGCDYCNFILEDYTPEKLNLHRLKIRIRELENESYWTMSDGMLQRLWHLQENLHIQKRKIAELKKHKHELKEIII